MQQPITLRVSATKPPSFHSQHWTVLRQLFSIGHMITWSHGEFEDKINFLPTYLDKKKTSSTSHHKIQSKPSAQIILNITQKHFKLSQHILLNTNLHVLMPACLQPFKLPVTNFFISTCLQCK